MTEEVPGHDGRDTETAHGARVGVVAGRGQAFSGVGLVAQVGHGDLVLSDAEDPHAGGIENHDLDVSKVDAPGPA